MAATQTGATGGGTSGGTSGGNNNNEHHSIDQHANGKTTPVEYETLAGTPSASASTSASTTTTSPSSIPPVRKRRRLPSGTDRPKSILKPAPPPQKAFSFRRDILQSLNSRLAQQGVNVQVPLPNAAATAQGAASLLGGMFKRIGGIAGVALDPGVAAQQQQQQRDGAAAAGAAAATTAATQPPPTSSSSIPPPTPSALPSSSSDPDSLSSSLASTSGLPAPSASPAPLKRVHFTVSHLSVIYPMGTGAPADEDSTRRRIERQHRAAVRSRRPQDWTPRELEILYRECCRMREEQPLKKMRLVFAEAALQSPPALKTLDLSFLPLDRQAIDPIADLLAVDFGLSKLVLENCSLTDDALKAILHALLISATLPNLSIASNRKIRYAGWRYVAVFMRRARALKYLDLSENSINRASMEHIVDAIRKPAEAVTRSAPAEDKKRGGEGAGGVATGEQAKSASGVGQPSKTATSGDNAGQHPTTALRESSDAAASAAAPAAAADDSDSDDEPLMPPAPLLSELAAPTSPTPTTSSLISLRMENCGIRGRLLSLLAPAVRFSDVKHLSLRRNRINQMGAVALAIMLKDYPDASPAASQVDAMTDADAAAAAASVASAAGNGDASLLLNGNGLDLDAPVITSSPAGGMTARRLPPAMTTASSATSTSEESRLAAADALSRARKAKRILGTMPRIGTLLTLDLKSNEIRGGVNYLAQILRKNRTLRVLNLSDNSIDMQGLVAIAEALKYNSTLETLDLSHNPCSGPGLEGITTLRQAFTLNSNLKRLFLNDTDLSSEGAIALAEFLPEARSLIHLDLTENFEIEMAGVMALAVSVRLNKSLRCLDLNIPPNDPDFARLSQEILQSCIRNTEAAQRKAAQKGITQPVAAPIYKSVVARAAKEKDERQRAMDATRHAEQEASAALEQREQRQQDHERLLEAARTCIGVLRDLLESEQSRRSGGGGNAGGGENGSNDRNEDVGAAAPPPPGDFVRDLVAQSNRLRTKLGRAVAGMGEGDVLERALKVNDDLDAVTSSLVAVYKAACAADNASASGEGAAAATSAAKTSATSPSSSPTPPPTLSPRAASKARAVDPDPDDGASTTTSHTPHRRHYPNGSITAGTPPRALANRHAQSMSAAVAASSVPVIDSVLSSPSFSIGSDNEDSDEDDSDEDAEGAGKRAAAAGANAEADAMAAMGGLRIDTGGSGGGGSASAEKEDLPPLHDEPSSPRGAVETKAREMVDEEGEIFKRARSLQVEEEEEEEEEEREREGVKRTDSPEEADADRQSRIDGLQGSSAPTAASSSTSTGMSRRRSSSSSSASSSSSPAAPTDVAPAQPQTDDVIDEDASGDELRRRLLASDPRGGGGGGGNGDDDGGGDAGDVSE